ncbi:ABC transporter ATP-binding protein [Providencia vermicola]|uniref:ABC transporter ATP-binding protein n=1 Tax=Providencia stuartii TaxID=588 RepID=A0ABD5L7C2_PROST|nr:MULTISPECIES: ABC transporter ATP-binding protein [Providencia]ELR5043108.1 ABC transporter ATP-binding protein [Providencia rettgeri]MCR4182162.1 ABC transporter ATP-binding protein/permease [Providencia vermicola]ELR5292928.1 ABC transporter ATP-binding protein [Providencia stuartii]MBG5920608.1 ABC transporter ATP-binding protein [Providencia stuartii]URE78870.1 ABC transporter ATP-binding protein/permease [Providencia stuartii]
MYRALWALLRPYRFTLTFALILQAIAGISSLIPWLAISQVALSPVEQRNTWVIIALISGILWLVCQTVALYLTHQTDNQLCYQLRLKILDKLHRLPLSEFVYSGKEGIQKMVDRDVRLLHQLTAHAPADSAQLLVVPITATLVLLWTNWALMIFCLLPLIITIYLFRQLRSPRYQSLFTARNQTMGDLYAQYAEFADNPLLARQYPNRAIQRAVTQTLSAFLIAFNHWVNKIGAFSSLTQIGMSTTLLTLWVIIGAFVVPTSVSLPQMVLFILLMHSITAPIAAMGHGADALNHAVAASERIRHFLEQPDMQYGDKSLQGVPCSIYIHDVDYCVQNKTLLSNLNLTIQPGQLIAIVGASGAGKSTLLQLMARFLDPTRGELYFDTTPLPQFSLAGLNQQVSIVMQNTQPMPYSLKENLQLFAPDATDVEITDYLEKLNLLTRFQQLPKGLDSLVGHDITLSGGEAQRLAIARVLLSKAPILLFDEPTSALDPQNAELFFQLLSQDPRTRILITHDLASLCHADTVILLEEGQIIAQGTHQQLSEHTPQYQQLLHALEETA